MGNSLLVSRPVTKKILNLDRNPPLVRRLVDEPVRLCFQCTASAIARGSFRHLLMCINNKSIREGQSIILMHTMIRRNSHMSNYCTVTKSMIRQLQRIRFGLKLIIYDGICARNIRELWNQTEVKRLQIAFLHLKYGITVHCCSLQTKNNPEKEFQMIPAE